MPRKPPQQLSTAPLAYENPAFINSPDGRILRILSEYSEPLARFRRERIHDTVVFFGSARLRSAADAEKALAGLPPAPGEEGAATTRRARAVVDNARYFEDARRL